MNADKFTQKTIETIQTAQSMAQENGNQYLTPEHLLYALVDADGGLIGTLLGRMGVDCNAVLSELDTAIDQLPKVSGGSGEVYASPETSKIFNFAEREAKSGGDAYVSVEHLMLGIFANETAAIKRIFSAHGITKAGFVAELKKVKTGPVTSDNPEDTYDALAKYGITPGSVELWGTGTPLREFLWSEDMADACVHVMEQVDFSQLKGEDREVRNCHINIGTGKEISIGDLARLIAATEGYRGELVFNADKPDGTMRKLTDVSKLHSLGWTHRVELEEGVERIYRWYLGQAEAAGN